MKRIVYFLFQNFCVSFFGVLFSICLVFESVPLILFFTYNTLVDYFFPSTWLLSTKVQVLMIMFSVGLFNSMIPHPGE